MSFELIAPVPIREDVEQPSFTPLYAEEYAMTRIGQQPPRYRFILNPYAEERFACCPECDGPTEWRKFPRVIHVDLDPPAPF